MDTAYSEAVGTKIDDKFNAFSFGTNIRGLTTQNPNPFRRSGTVFLPNNQDTLYPGFNVPPCSFEKTCCNMPPSSTMTITGRLKNCADPAFEESISRWSYNTYRPAYAKPYTTSRIGLDSTENI